MWKFYFIFSKKKKNTKLVAFKNPQPLKEDERIREWNRIEGQINKQINDVISV